VKSSFAPFVLGLALLGPASIARADGDWYAAIDAGNSWIGVFSSSYGDNTDHGYRLAAGYDIDHYFSVEAGYVDFGKATTTNSCVLNVCLGGVTEFKARAFTLDGLGHLPLSESWTMFARLGVNRGHLETDSPIGSVSADTTGIDWGFGADYRFSEAWKLRLQFEQCQGLGDTQAFKGFGSGIHALKGNVSLTSIGVSYSFR